MPRDRATNSRQVAKEDQERVARAALSSFFAFGLGAVIPVLPYLFGGGGTSAIAVSGLLSGAALFAVGAVISFLTGRGALFSGLRMLVIGAAASVVTFLIGRAIGVQTT